MARLFTHRDLIVTCGEHEDDIAVSRKWHKGVAFPLRGGRPVRGKQPVTSKSRAQQSGTDYVFFLTPRGACVHSIQVVHTGNEALAEFEEATLSAGTIAKL